MNTGFRVLVVGILAAGVVGGSGVLNARNSAAKFESAQVAYITGKSSLLTARSSNSPEGYRKAVEYFLKANKRVPSKLGYLGLAECYHALGMRDEAERAIVDGRRVRQLTPWVVKPGGYLYTESELDEQLDNLHMKIAMK